MGEESEGVFIQRREYDILIGLKEAKTALSATFGEPETDGTAKRWSGSRLWGLVRAQAELDREDGTVVYSTWRTRRFQLLEIGLLIGLLALAISYWGLQNRSDLIWFLEFIFANETNSDVFRFVLLVLALIVGMTALSRGPGPAFDTGGLEEISRTYSMFYYLYLGLAVVIFGIAFGTVANLPLFVVAVMLTLYGLYVYGSDPAIQSDLGDALPVVPQSGLSKAKPYALISLCALSLPVVAMTANLLPVILLPTPQSGLAGVFAQVAIPVGFTLIYCYGCLWALRIIDDAAVEPYTSRLPRALVFCILLTINVFLVFIFALAVLEVIYAVLPGGILADIKYEAGDISWIVGGLILLSGLAGVAGWFQHKLAAGDGPEIDRLPILCARMTGLGALFAVFMISSYVFANLVGLVMFGDAAILDPSPETIRLQTEQFLFVKSHLGWLPGPAWVAVASVQFLRWCPITLIGLAWAHRVQTEVQFKLRVRAAPELDTSTRPVPASVPVKVLDTDQPLAGATMTLTGSPSIVVGRAVVEALSGTASGNDGDALDALLIHELHHLERQDHLIGIAATLGSLLVGGQNAVLSLYNLQQAERDADLAAVRAIDTDTLAATLSGVQEVARTADPNSGVGESTPALLGDTTTVARQAAETTQHHTELLVTRLKQVILAPSRLLFSGIIHDHAHQDLPDRLEIASLPDAVCQYVAGHTTTTQVAVPESTTVTCHVTQEQVISFACARGSHRDEAERIIAMLLEDGRLTEPRPGWLATPGDSR